MILFEDVGKCYAGSESFALRHFSEIVGDGEFLVLTGRSGIGKTTLLKLLTREEQLSEGRILVDGEDIGALPPSRVPFFRRKLGVIFQDFRLVADLSVYDNLSLARRIYGWGRKETDERILHVLAFLGIDRLHKRLPAELSGGEQQKVCLARAILNDPKLLLADEPSRNLDPRASRELLHLLELIHRQGVTVLLATHDLENVKKEVPDHRERALPETEGKGYA
ncbi:MAG: ATP-binding cassette domain-containing protein [Lachnospiraceae bacterium]|nr:ATP-binding cassette domain-containing protein [Lachnospiraceae bacterium]